MNIGGGGGNGIGVNQTPPDHWKEPSRTSRKTKEADVKSGQTFDIRIFRVCLDFDSFS